MSEKSTLDTVLRSVLEAHGVTEIGDLPQHLVDATVEYIAGSDVRVEGVPVPIDIALALVDRGALRIEVVDRGEA